jgi:hypothetical protein
VPERIALRLLMMTQVQMVFLTIVLQAITVAIAAFVVVFYFFPDKIVFGAKASIILGLVLSGYQFISPNLSRLLGIRDAYIKFIVAYTEGIWSNVPDNGWRSMLDGDHVRNDCRTLQVYARN